MDHPRIRGTNSGTGPLWIDGAGSPPHTRDKWKNKMDFGIGSGITPAYAGQIFIGELRKVEKRDHPRIRGTNSSTLAPLRLE